MAAIDRDRAPPRRGNAGRITPSLFSIAFGLAGLGGAWHAAGPVLGTSDAVPDAVYILAGRVWLILAAAYAVQGPPQDTG